jgi:4-hydroxyphenylpyruvate dioxygenase
MNADREAIGELANPLGIEGLEFVEYATTKPQALGQVLETMGFRPIARHRSREVLLYRQGGMNIVVNAHGAMEMTTPRLGSGPAPTDDVPAISAFALRVRDAGAAHRRALERGAWPVPVNVQPMELHIPAIHGAGASRIYFVDRWREFSIWDVDFVPIPTVEPQPPALAGLHWFGLVQYVGLDRMDDWTTFYAELFGWRALPDDERFGILPRGRLLQSPCGLMLQLVEPEPDTADFEHDETLQRVGFGVPDVPAAVQALRARGVEFVETEKLHSGSRGALTRAELGGVMFELVQDTR